MSQHGGGSVVEIPAIEITKDGTGDVTYLCENDDGDYIVETPSSGRRSSSHHSHHHVQQHQQQVRILDE